MIVPDLILKAAGMLDRWEHHWEGIREDIETWAIGLHTDPAGMNAYRMRFRSLVQEQSGLAQVLREMVDIKADNTRQAENERLRQALEHAENVSGKISGNVSLRWLRAAMLNIDIDSPEFDKL